jgi:hypothetical protein
LALLLFIVRLSNGCAALCSSSEEELQFSDDDEMEEGPDVAWQEMVWRSYRRKFAPPSSVPQQHQQLSVPSSLTSNQPTSSGTDTETMGGASDADWETDSGTECENEQGIKLAFFLYCCFTCGSDLYIHVCIPGQTITFDTGSMCLEWTGL